MFKRLLEESLYDPQKIEHLVVGFTHGFDMGYRGPTARQDTADNIPIRVGSTTDMWNKIMKEVQLGRYAGPFKNIPYKNYVQSPIGLVPKANNKTRLIFHLSYDFPEFKSVNFYMLDEICMVQYKDLNHAIQTCLHMRLLWPGSQGSSQGVCFAKTDIICAFRILPSSPGQCYLFILKA